MVVVHKLSRGIPRLVNTLCENSLISGYSRFAKQITPQIVQEVAADLRLDQVTSPPAANSNGVATREQVLKVLKALSLMMEELGRAPEKPFDDAKFESGVKVG
jgi:hypothetical protein